VQVDRVRLNQMLLVVDIAGRHYEFVVRDFAHAYSIVNDLFKKFGSFRFFFKNDKLE